MGSLFDAVTRGKVWIAVMVLVEGGLEAHRGTGEAERQPEMEFDWGEVCLIGLCLYMHDVYIVVLFMRQSYAGHFTCCY